MISTCSSFSPIFSNFKTINVIIILMNFSVLLVKMVQLRVLPIITGSSNKKLKLPFRKTKLGIQSLFFVGPNTWSTLPDNLKSVTSVNSFKQYIKEYFLKRLGLQLQLNRSENEICNFFRIREKQYKYGFYSFFVSISRSLF